MGRVLAGISVSLGWLAFVLMAVEARTQIASWLAGRDTHGLLIVLFALIGWGVVATPQIALAGAMGFGAAALLTVLYVFDGGAGGLAYVALAAVLGAAGTAAWGAVQRAED